MSLPSPNLDDRTFAQLVAEAKRRASLACRDWTDLSDSDPGIVLLELFAYLTETMIYRLNRVPDKVYVELLRLLGVTLRPPTAALTELSFGRPKTAAQAIEIPRGTRVTAGGGGAAGGPIFTTVRAVTLPAGATSVSVTALACELVDGELAGVGTGLPGQSVVARRPPIVAPTGDGLDLVVGVEVAAGELAEGLAAVQHEGRTFRVWREVESFTNLGSDRFVYLADRVSGRITFAPAARNLGADGELSERPLPLAEMPPAERQIRLWYRRGGGRDGNVAAGALTTLKDPIPGLTVVNPGPAAGGRDAESVDNALVRGPQQLHTLERAVTARDFELLALASSGGVARAKAFTKAELWAHAQPGTVEVLLVPELPAAPGAAGEAGPVDAARLAALERQEVRAQILAALDERRPLGTTCLVNWARYKTVKVAGRVVVYRQENPVAVRERVLARLSATLSPLPHGDKRTPGWPFGQALRASHVYEAILAEPGVAYADSVRLLVDEVPAGNVTALAADAFQRAMWYAGCGGILYRSGNDGDGWEPAGRFPGESVEAVAPHPERPGHLAVLTRVEGEGGTRLHLSLDCGETWQPAARLGFQVEDMAWVVREGVSVLLLATEKGLYELALKPGATPLQVLVVPGAPDLGFYAVAVATDLRGGVQVTVAAQKTGGVYLSAAGGRAETFQKIGLEGEDVRVLAVQADGPRLFLWAGLAAEGGSETGRGCFVRELRGSVEAVEAWRPQGKGWKGGSCHALAFQGGKVLAATHQAGVLKLDGTKSDAEWWSPEVGSGLPMRDRGRFYPVRALGTDPDGRLLLAGTPVGVVRSANQGTAYEPASSREFTDKVTLPPTWLFSPGAHEIEVVSEDARPGH